MFGDETEVDDVLVHVVGVLFATTVVAHTGTDLPFGIEAVVLDC